MTDPNLPGGTHIHYPCPECGDEGPHLIRFENAELIAITCRNGHMFEVRV